MPQQSGIALSLAVPLLTMPRRRAGGAGSGTRRGLRPHCLGEKSPGSQHPISFARSPQMGQVAPDPPTGPAFSGPILCPPETRKGPALVCIVSGVWSWASREVGGFAGKEGRSRRQQTGETIAGKVGKPAVVAPD